jgi:hypothetical protein
MTGENIKSRCHKIKRTIDKENRWPGYFVLCQVIVRPKGFERKMMGYYELAFLSSLKLSPM